MDDRPWPTSAEQREWFQAELLRSARERALDSCALRPAASAHRAYQRSLLEYEALTPLAVETYEGVPFPGRSTPLGRMIALASVADADSLRDPPLRMRVPIPGPAARILRAAVIARYCRTAMLEGPMPLVWTPEAVARYAFKVPAGVSIPTSVQLFVGLSFLERGAPWQRAPDGSWRMRWGWDIADALANCSQEQGVSDDSSAFNERPAFVFYRHRLRQPFGAHPLLLPGLVVGRHHGTLRAVTIESQLDEIAEENVAAVVKTPPRLVEELGYRQQTFARLHTYVNATDACLERFRRGDRSALTAIGSAAVPLVGRAGLAAWTGATSEAVRRADGPTYARDAARRCRAAVPAT